ncbi:MAG: DUF2752 domain-containing protein [Ignavibacteria bacterium]|nr:DUF2752 domain-containing protein [Ignavibacteria bacterium]
MSKIFSYIKLIELEALMWAFALSYLLFINPYEPQIFSLCLFHNIGIESCPGCGIGRSISFFYHSDIIRSIQTHPLGIVAFILIVLRISSLFIKMKNNFIKLKRGLTWQTSTN